MTDKARLLRDKTAGQELFTWGKRHNDPFAQAIGLARMGACPTRWDTITDLAPTLSPSDLADLDQALCAWPDPMRIVFDDWVRPGLLPCLSIARSLTLRSCQMGYQDLQRIAQCEHIIGLSTLDLSANSIKDEGARVIAESQRLRGLTRLEIFWNQIGDDGARAIAQSQHLRGLITLDLSLNQIGDEGARALAQSPHLSSLTTLDLSDNDISAAGARALAQSPFLNEDIRNEWKVFVYNELLKFWRARSIVFRAPASAEAIAKFEQKNNIQLTNELKTLLSFADGFDYDDEFRFLALDEFMEMIHWVKNGERYIMLIDYMTWCWGYGVNVDPESEHYGGVFLLGGSSDDPNKIANNLEDFLYLYMSDDERLYDP
jgi:hypothetical protein